MTTTVNRTSTLGGRLRTARLFAGIEQIDLSDTLSVGRNTISNWENDKVAMPATALIRWSELTGVSLNWLAYGREVRPEGFEPPTY